MINANTIVNLKEYDLVLSYSFGHSKRSCTGHIFECIEYFHILKSYMKCCILIGDCIDFEYIIGLILKKYTFSDDEVEFLLDSICISDNPNIIMGNKLLLVDGNFKRLKDKFLKFDKIWAFPCGVRGESDYPNNVVILGDKRIYKFDKIIDYKKKMLFSKMDLTYNTNVEYDYMLYITEGPRYLSDDDITNIISKYDGSFVIYTDYKVNVEFDNVTIMQVPVDNVFNFGTYIYTSIERQFDCSPRFIVECVLKNKKILFDLDYPMSYDSGLYYRYEDLKDIQKIELNECDDIVSIMTE